MRAATSAPRLASVTPPLDHLTEHRDVSALEVLGVDRARQVGEFGGSAGTLERRPVVLHAALADQIEHREQQISHAAEVVEDQRLVEAPLAGDCACTGAGKAFRLQCLQGGFDNLQLCAA